jgi:hypothetical protein
MTFAELGFLLVLNAGPVSGFQDQVLVDILFDDGEWEV